LEIVATPNYYTSPGSNKRCAVDGSDNGTRPVALRVAWGGDLGILRSFKLIIIGVEVLIKLKSKGFAETSDICLF
jgi:hypothetical protein